MTRVDAFCSVCGTWVEAVCKKGVWKLEPHEFNDYPYQTPTGYAVDTKPCTNNNVKESIERAIREYEGMRGSSLRAIVAMEDEINEKKELLRRERRDNRRAAKEEARCVAALALLTSTESAPQSSLEGPSGAEDCLDDPEGVPQN